MIEYLSIIFFHFSSLSVSIIGKNNKQQRKLKMQYLENRVTDFPEIKSIMFVGQNPKW